MRRRLVDWVRGLVACVDRFFTKPKESLDEKAENLFKAFEGITEGDSPTSQAKVFEYFTRRVKNHFETGEKTYTDLSDANIKRAEQFKKASEWCFPPENKCNQTK